jgi:hypothetical protein
VVSQESRNIGAAKGSAIARQPSEPGHIDTVVATARTTAGSISSRSLFVVAGPADSLVMGGGKLCGRISSIREAGWLRTRMSTSARKVSVRAVCFAGPCECVMAGQFLAGRV